jgi:hypothetical protein
LLSTALQLIQFRTAAITMNTPPASSPASAPEQPPAPQSRTIDFATEWLDEDGRVCPKNVDYATQCPKGHQLMPLGGGGGGGGGCGADVMCRVCHASTPRQHACQWLVCSVAGCCGGYAVCAACASALDRADAADAVSEDFPLEVGGTQAAPLQCCCCHAHAAELRRA